MRMYSVCPLVREPSQQLTGEAALLSLSTWKKSLNLSDSEAVY